MSKKKDIKRILKLLKEDAIMFSVSSVHKDYVIEFLNLKPVYGTDILNKMEDQDLIKINREKIPFEVELL